MDINLTWSVNNLKYNAVDDGVFEVRWSLTAQDDVHTRTNRLPTRTKRFSAESIRIDKHCLANSTKRKSIN